MRCSLVTDLRLSVYRKIKEIRKMNLKNYHKAQLKASFYKLISCPGVLSEQDCVDVLDEILGELTEGEYNA